MKPTGCEEDMLRGLASMPFIDRLEDRGLAAAFPHASDLIPPTRRYHLTASGLRRLAGDEGMTLDGLLRSRPVSAQCEELERWSRGLGEIHAFGIEGTGSYGAGVARFLTSRGHTVVEVNRPDRSTRYRKGKSDPTDAEMAARAVLAGVADATPKSGEGEVEMIRMLKSTKDSAVKARTQAINQMKVLVVTAPARLREHLTGLTVAALVTRSKSFRPGRMEGPHRRRPSMLFAPLPVATVNSVMR